MRELSRYHRAVEVIEDQANDERLWCRAETIMEDTLQKELRRLHAAVEGVSSEECAVRALDQ